MKPPASLVQCVKALRFAAAASALSCLIGACDFLKFPEPERDDETKNAAAGMAGMTGAPVSSVGDLCNPQSDPCGPSEAGEPMTCFQASALAGDDFCIQACDPSAPATDDGHVCMESGALLERCHPNGRDSRADCPAGLNCYRTSLSKNEGLCIRMPVCKVDADCPSPSHDTCGSSLITGYSAAIGTLLPLDHLNCVKTDCVKYNSACGAAEGCLGTQYSTEIADLCTPSCAAGQCPPNYSCARNTSGPGSPPLCIPGVPGFRCDGPHCILGDCEETGAGFSVCTQSCESDDDCAVFNTSSDQFLCVEGGGHRHCVTPRPFNGANCDSTENCNADRNEFCSKYGVIGRHGAQGECRVPCNEDGTCDPQGGLPHTCLWGRFKGGCFPGHLGLPCTLSSECFPGLTCEDAPAQPDLDAAPERICTMACGVEGGNDADADATCNPDKAINRLGYCGGGFCRAQRPDQQSCTRDAQCMSSLCNSQTKSCAADSRVAPAAQ